MLEKELNGEGPSNEHNEDKDLFEIQHHHLLRCLEKTTVSTHETT